MSDKGTSCVTDQTLHGFTVPELVDEYESEVVRFDGWTKVEENESSMIFPILGTSVKDTSSKPHVLSPPLMDALRSFLPFASSEDNYWMKYSLIRDGASLSTLLSKVEKNSCAIIAIETMDGDVFGSFTNDSWKRSNEYYGSGVSLLWRVKKARFAPRSIMSKKSHQYLDSELEVYPFAGVNDYVQRCTERNLYVGGGDWIQDGCPYDGNQCGVGLMLDSDLEYGESYPCATFASPALCKNSKAGCKFQVVNVEVWTLTPCSSLSAAVSLESHKSFVASNSVTG
eukprot:13192587-Ditylum_brightwellii.AAC.1